MQGMGVSTDLDFQTVFQILIAFEGLCVWKAEKVSSPTPVVDLKEPEPPDYKSFQSLCERFKTERKAWMLPLLAFYLFAPGIRRFIKKTGLFLARAIKCIVTRLYLALSSVLRVSPFLSIPLISCCYFFKWKFSGDQFQGGRLVLWYLSGKTCCIFCCACLNWILKKRIVVKPVAISTDGISTVPPQ